MTTELESIENVLNRTILGKETQIKLALTCLLANGHLLLEDLPGMGKTTLSHALANAFGLAFSRVQFTSDLLPADMLGVSIFNQQTHSFTFHEGPIFNQVVLADEINRASPKTQSALLEAMEERQVSIDGNTHALPKPFFVIATQNPGFQSGTYPLPESQLDRFLMRVSLGYPNWEAEKDMLLQNDTTQKKPFKAVITENALLDMQHKVSLVHASESIIEYILRLVALSRTADYVDHPLSPRASKAILQAAKSWAFLHNRDYVVPEDIQSVFTAVVEHRIRGENTTESGALLSQKLLDNIDPLAA
ncbi:AAA family ATPase [Alteromonas sediminis]|uniref:AAA family ATPase n=1 Tax=Alteromonas sediminis TaxID=2259342 RepID=A0A3N5YCV4_9ALTE|nr:AAA family ATPase [Alteromonas sediminis]RPJ67195.1 AAA family ATPase [Alteromonas sediminis]